MRLNYVATNAEVKKVLAGIGALSRTWDSVAVPLLNRELSKKLGRTVVLLKGNYVRQKKGAVSYHGANPLLGSFIPGGRKGYDSKTGSLYLWVIIK